MDQDRSPLEALPVAEYYGYNLFPDQPQHASSCYPTYERTLRGAYGYSTYFFEGGQRELFPLHWAFDLESRRGHVVYSRRGEEPRMFDSRAEAAAAAEEELRNYAEELRALNT